MTTSKWRARMSKNKPTGNAVEVVLSVRRPNGNRIEFFGNVKEQIITDMFTKLIDNQMALDGTVSK